MGKTSKELFNSGSQNEVSILEQADKVCLTGLVESEQSGRLKVKIRLEIRNDLSHKPLEGQLADKKIYRLLVTSGLMKCNRPGTISMGLLDTFPLLEPYMPLKDARLYSAIDELALLSAKAMQLRQPLTTCEKIVNADNVLYIMWEKDEQKGVSRLIGMLKVGRKQLFLYDREMKTYEGELLALLDFYVHFSYQRQGYGKKLFEFMLHYERIAAHDVAFDNPTVTLLAFMAKHYGLTDAIWQNTNFVVFPQLFGAITVDDASAPEGWRRPSTPRHIGRGATDTRWLEHAITGHPAKGNSTGSPVECDSSAAGTFTNRANQARLRKAHILSSKPLW
ncbi:Alpha-tubulin N-acetyltransferase 1 [Toxocara canis]|uniref:Alpha-tubulin N-acetyltransferase n=1 Tax=Toxocara canis TaxID=6265 RepID=A0A0B2VXF3_TOXCA|nr:Alpha-tubulin N-acetyltransferase 1 [Toxocara canis]